LKDVIVTIIQKPPVRPIPLAARKVLPFILFALFCAVVPAGCGEDKPTGLAPQEDAAATAERNKGMEDYMKSAAGKAANKPPK